MKERIIDTNIILRYLTDDLPDQAEKCERLFKRILEEKESVEIPLLVIAEVIWTLTKFYRLPKEEAAENVSIILKTQKIRVRDKKVILDALESYKKTNVGFTDAYIATYSLHSEMGIYSFDKDFDSLGVDRKEP